MREKWETAPGRSGRQWSPMGGAITDQEFDLYVSDQAHQYAGQFEISDGCLYSTVMAEAYQENGRLDFFQKAEGPKFSQNMTDIYIPGMLPNPQAFCIHAIKIFGIPSSLVVSCFVFRLGSKEFLRRPTWLANLRWGSVLNPRLFIPPMVSFNASISWDGPLNLGRGFDGRPLVSRPIQVALTGRIARPMQ